MQRDRLPTWLRIWGILAWPGALYFVGRIVWEETLLTWRQGPQMVGFSLAHSGLILPLLLSVVLAVVWLTVVLVRSAVSLHRARKVSASRWLMLVGGAALLCLLLVPYGFWQRLDAASIAKGPNAAEFLTYAAATGDLETVKTLLSHGVGVNALDSNGATALHGAAVEGETKLIAFLLTEGADLSIKNQFGRTALDNAREMDRREVIRYLTEHGAK